MDLDCDKSEATKKLTLCGPSYYLYDNAKKYFNYMKKRKTILIACVWGGSYFLAMAIEMGFGGGTSRQTEGTSMSRPPGPVTCHLLRWLLSFRMPSLSLQITFCGHRTAHTLKVLLM